jgi:hypothetical protein
VIQGSAITAIDVYVQEWQVATTFLLLYKPNIRMDVIYVVQFMWTVWPDDADIILRHVLIAGLHGSCGQGLYLEVLCEVVNYDWG